MYSDDDMLMLSGIQHYRFCPRQWALIHIEQQWEDNRLTIEGQFQHRRVDDPFYRQKCGNSISLRSVNIASRHLGLYGITDVVELHPTVDTTNSIRHPKYAGLWHPYPIEYKHGRPKRDEVDEVQLTAQAMCTEAQYTILKNALNMAMDENLDSIRFYHLNKNKNHSIEVLGKITSYDVCDAIIL